MGILSAEDVLYIVVVLKTACFIYETNWGGTSEHSDERSTSSLLNTDQILILRPQPSHIYSPIPFFIHSSHLAHTSFYSS